MDHLFVCIMAGGSGERFWPLSRKATPKHLLKLFSDSTLVAQTVRRVEGLVPRERIFVLTNEAQIKNTRQAVPFLSATQIIAEPAKRDTAPACAFGTALVRSRDPQGVVALLPADALVKDEATFRRQLAELAALASETPALLTFGISPSIPATGFGYIELGAKIKRPRAKTAFHEVRRFVEKPDLATAKKYVASRRFWWNAGMFIWRADAFLAEARRLQPALASFIEGFPSGNFGPYLKKHFPVLPKISVDYGIMEKAARVIVAKAEFDWDDIGTWTALPTHLGADRTGNTVRGQVALHDSQGNIVFAQKRVVALCGVKDLIIVETDDALLVCHRDSAQDIKKLHALLPDRVL